MSRSESNAGDNHPDADKMEYQHRQPLYFGFDIALRPRMLKIKVVPYPRAVIIPAHEFLPQRPETADAARSLLMSYKESAAAYVNAAGAASDFASWPDNMLMTGGKILYEVLRRNQRSQIGFGVPRVRGFKSDPSQTGSGSDSIEVPFPGWILRSMSFSGPANSRDIALFFKLVAICNIYEENIAKSAEDVNRIDLMTWSVPYSGVAGAIFKGHVSRLIASLDRLSVTMIRPVDDIINPRRKLDTNIRLLEMFSIQGKSLSFSLSRPFCEAVLGRTRYAHVNVRTLCTLRSMYGIRSYLLGLGFCALGAWSRSGGVTRVLMTEANLKKILLEDALTVRDGEFRRDVLRQIRKDFSRVCYVSEEEAASRPPNYDGRERMRMHIIQHPQDDPSFSDGFNSQQGGIGLYLDVTAAPESHRAKHSIDARVLAWRSRKVNYDLETIRNERNRKRSVGAIEARLERFLMDQIGKKSSDTGAIYTTKTTPATVANVVVSEFLETTASGTQDERFQKVGTWMLREACLNQEDEDEEDLDIAPEEEEDDNPEGYIYPPEED